MQTRIIEIAGTTHSKVVLFKNQRELFHYAEEFMNDMGFEEGYYTLINVYDPNYSLDVCVDKFYI